MKRLLILCCAIALVSACEEEEWEDMEHNYYNGDIHIGEYVDGPSTIEELLALGYNAIDGNLTIWGKYKPKRLSFLDQIYEVTGTVTIRDINPISIFDNLIEVGGAVKIINVKEVDDFPALERVRSIHIRESHFLTISAFNMVEECDSIYIRYHHGQINDLNAFASLPEAEYLYLNLNQRTDQTFSGLDNLSLCNSLTFYNVGMNAMPALERIKESLYVTGSIGSGALSACQSVKAMSFEIAENLNSEIFANPLACSTLFINSCSEIADLQWTTMIDSLQAIEILNNNSLLSLDGLEVQDELFKIRGYENDSLIDYCSLVDLDIDIARFHGNAYDPSWEEIIGGDCLMPDDPIME